MPESEIVTVVSNTVPTGFLILSAWKVKVSRPLKSRNVGSICPVNSHFPLYFDAREVVVLHVSEE